MKSIATLLVLYVCITFVMPAYAQKTNINEVTDLFDKNIENKDQLFKDLQDESQGAQGNIASKNSFNLIPGMDGSEIKVQELKSIKVTDLDSAGRAKRASSEYQFYDENELEPNYEKAGNKIYKLDAEEIADATDKTIGDLVSKLKEFGVDCKTVKGSVQKEPVYYIDIKREQQKNVEYDQFFCEEPRNTYNCNNTLTTRCIRRGKRWHAWQDKTVRIDGDTIYRNANYLGYSIKWKRKRHGWHLRQDSAGWRQFLSSHLNIPIEQIHEQIHFPDGARGVGSATHPVYERWRIVFDQYEFKYKYREGYEVCEQWEDTWNERCTLQ